MKWNSNLCTNIRNYIFWLWFFGMIHIEGSCGELCLRLVSNDAVCSSRTCCKSEEQSAYWVAGVQATFVKKLCYWSGFYFEKFDSSSHPVIYNFVTILFNIILPLKFTSVECYHYSELKRILMNNKFFQYKVDGNLSETQKVNEIT